MPCDIMYIVTVRLMSSTLLWNSFEMTWVTGKYMSAVRGLYPGDRSKVSRKVYIYSIYPTHLKSAAKDAIVTINTFSLRVKTL